MKNLLIALVILSSLVSCGKKNTVGGAPVASASAMVGSTAIETDFINKVNGNLFGTGYSSVYNETYAQAISKGANPKLTYANYAAPAASAAPTPHCILGGLLCGSVSTSSTTFITPTITSVNTLSITVVEKQSAISAIFAKKSRVEQYGPTVFGVLTNDNATYYFDTTMPIQANPVRTYNADRSMVTLINAQ